MENWTRALRSFATFVIPVIALYRFLVKLDYWLYSDGRYIVTCTCKDRGCSVH